MKKFLRSLRNLLIIGVTLGIVVSIVRLNYGEAIANFFQNHAEALSVYGAGLFGLMLALPFLALALGQSNKIWSIVQEGTARIFTRAGKYRKTAINYEGFYLKDGEEVAPKVNGKPKDPWRQKLFGGLRFMGPFLFFDDVYKYNFRWQTLERTVSEDGKAIKKVKSHEEELNYVFLKAATYYGKLASIPIKGNLIVDIDAIICVRIVNPRKALFRAHQWYEFMIDNVLPHVRQFAADKTFAQLAKMGQLKSDKLYDFLEHDSCLTEEQKQMVRQELTNEGRTEKEIQKELEERELGIIGVLRKIYGIHVISVKIDDVDAEERYKLALSKLEEAKLEAKRIRQINSEIARHGHQALVIRYLEAIENAAKEPSKMILPLGLQGLIKEITSGLSLEGIKELKKSLKEGDEE